MRDYILTQSLSRDSTYAFPRLRRMLRSWFMRRDLRRLEAFDDYMLNDIGLMRGLRLLGSAEGVKEEIHAIRSRRGQHHPLVHKMMAAAAAGTDG